jgi:hypothetical protein
MEKFSSLQIFLHRAKIISSLNSSKKLLFLIYQYFDLAIVDKSFSNIY